MYKQHVKSIKKNTITSNIIVPIVISAIIIMILNSTFAFLDLILKETNSDSVTSLSSMISMILSVVIGAILIKKVSSWSWFNLGWHKKNFFPSYFVGAVIGVLAITIVFIINLLLKSIEVSYVFTSSALVPFLISFIFFLFQGTYEELIFRSYLMPFFSRKIGDIASLIITSLMFAALHVFNDNFSAMGFINLIIFGLVFGSAYLKTGSLWIVGATHTFWNFFLGPVFGSNVSGVSQSNTILLSKLVGNITILNGGNYGLEGSIVASVIGIILILIFLKGYKFSSSKEYQK